MDVGSWIAVGSALPEENVPVLGWCEWYRDIHIATYHGETNYGNDGSVVAFVSSDDVHITHWVPLYVPLTPPTPS